MIQVEFILLFATTVEVGAANPENMNVFALLCGIPQVVAVSTYSVLRLHLTKIVLDVLFTIVIIAPEPDGF